MKTQKIECNDLPTYFAYPYVVPETGELIENRFTVKEYVNGEFNTVFHIDNDENLMHNLLARGIPAEDAKSLFYKITSND
jgi:hypothetical protein